MMPAALRVQNRSPARNESRSPTDRERPNRGRRVEETGDRFVPDRGEERPC